ncbi:MAG: LamG domain-containing protein [Verrucomicrobiota bacterium]
MKTTIHQRMVKHPLTQRLGRAVAYITLGLAGIFIRPPTARTSTNGCFTVPAGLVGWWRAEGDATDYTGANSGSFPFGSAFAPGVVGQAFDFDGSSRRVSIPDSPALQLTNAMTLEAWVYPRAYGGFITFRGDNRGGLDNWTLDTYDAGFVKFSLIDPTNNAVSLRAPLALNQWQHVAATWSRASGDLKIYINGTLSAQTNSPLVPIGALDPAYEPAIGIGNHGGTFHQFPFNGLIDELGIYNRALNSNEIASIVVAGSAGKCTSSTPPASSGWLLSIDFGADENGNDKTGFAALGQATNDFWNFYSRDDGAGGWRTFGVLSNLKTVGGTVTPAGLTVANAPGAWGNSSPDKMYDDYIYPFNSGNVTVTVTNLPAGQYDVLAYANDGNFDLAVGGYGYGTRTCPGCCAYQFPGVDCGRPVCALHQCKRDGGPAAGANGAPWGLWVCHHFRPATFRHAQYLTPYRARIHRRAIASLFPAVQ